MSIESAAHQTESSRPTQPYVATADGKRRFASDGSIGDLERKIHYAVQHTSLRRSNGWESHEDSLKAVVDRFLVPKVREKKDGRCYVPGRIVGDSRIKNAVARLDLMVFDLDRSKPEEIMRVLAEIDADGLAYFFHTTFSHLSAETEVPYDKYKRFAQESDLDPAGNECARRYLREKKKYEDEATEDSGVVEAARQTAEGMMVVLNHAPMHKYRLVFVLDRPFVIAEWLAKGFSDDDVRTRLWSAALEIVARQYGLSYDTTCKDASRAYYPAGCPDERLGEANSGGMLGMALRLDAVVPATPEALDAIVPKTKAKPGAKAGGSQGQGSTTGEGRPALIEYEGRNISASCGKYGRSYQLEDALRARAPDDKFRAPRPAGGTHMECPFEAEHSTTGGAGFFVVNASDNGEFGFGLHCSHASCQTARGNGGRSVDRAQYIAEFLRLGWLTLEDLENGEFGGGPVPWLKPTKNAIRAMIDKLDSIATSDDLDPVIDALARYGDRVFDAEALRLIEDKTGQKNRTALRKAIEHRRKAQKRENRKHSAREAAPTTQDNQQVYHFYNWDRVPFYGVAEAAKDHLVAQNKTDPRLFVRGTQIVRAITDTTTAAKQISTCGLDEVLAELERVTTWSKKTPNEMAEENEEPFEPRFSPVPKRVGEHFMATEAASLALPYLRDVMDTPYFNKNAELVTANGYNPASGILLAVPNNFALPEVSDNPTEDEIAEARESLQDLYLDFPFWDGEEGIDLARWQSDRAYRMTIGKGSRANQIAKTIQPFVAEMIDGSLMLHLVSKVMRRTGAGYMQDGCGLVTAGCTPAVATLPNDETEVQKLLLTKAMEGSKHLIFDNQKEARVVQSESLASAQTAGRLSGRILGQSRTGSGPWRCLVEINGNNLAVHEDIACRGLWVELNAHRKDPENRSGFTHDPYQRWVMNHRAKFVWAILTIVQAWIARGRRGLDDRERVIGGIEEYCRTIGGILQTAGIEGFNSNRARIGVDAAQVSDVEAYLTAMLEVFGTTEVSVGVCESSAGANPNRYLTYGEANLVELLLDISGDVTLGLFDNPNKGSLGSRLGRKLGTYVGRPFDLAGKCYILTSRKAAGITKYHLSPQDGVEVPKTQNKMRLSPK